MRLLAECPFDTGAPHSCSTLHCSSTALVRGGDVGGAARARLRRRLHPQRTQLRAKLIIESSNNINNR